MSKSRFAEAVKLGNWGTSREEDTSFLILNILELSIKMEDIGPDKKFVIP